MSGSRSSFRWRPASGSLLHAAGTDAGGADADVFVSAVNDSPHASQIWIPAAPADVMGVADLVAVTRFFAAEFTGECHVGLLQTRRHSKIVDFDPTRERRRQEAIWPPVRRAVLGPRSNPSVHVQITLSTVDVDEPNAPGSRAQIEARNRYRKFEPPWTGTAGIEIEHAIAFYP